MHIPGCQKNGAFHIGIQKNRAIHILFVEKRGPIIYLAALKKGAIRHAHPYYAIYRKIPLPHPPAPPPPPSSRVVLLQDNTKLNSQFAQSRSYQFLGLTKLIKERVCLVPLFFTLRRPACDQDNTFLQNDCIYPSENLLADVYLNIYQLCLQVACS